MPKKLIIDCDPGIDDAIALMMARANPSCEVLGVTTVSGNQTIEKVTDNAQRLTEFLGLSGARVHQGSAAPLVRDAVRASSHGDTGLGGWELPRATRALATMGAVDFIVESVRSNPEHTITLVAIGPLTNVALALRQDPSIAQRLDQIVIMGGGWNAGNFTPNAEFNFYADPEAADEVMRSGSNIVMLGLDLTWQSAVPHEVLTEIAEFTSPVARAVEGWITFYSQIETTPGEVGPSVHDACAIAYVLDPTLITTQPACVLIETRGQWTYGASIVDEEHRFELEDNVQIGRRLDRDRFWRLVLESLRSYEP